MEKDNKEPRRRQRQIEPKEVDLAGAKQGSVKGLPWLVAGVVIAILGVFVLPWHVPLPGPVHGESYCLGFYNKVAIIALCLSFVFVFVGHLRNGKKSSGLTWFVCSPVIFPPFRKARTEYIVLGLAALICAIAIMVWNAYLVDPYWSEGAYFLSRIDLAMLGYKPYTDFEFNYGPAFVYTPVWLDWLSAGTLGIENAYALCLTLGFVLGFIAFFIFQRFLNLPDQHRPWILALILLVWFILTMGFQATPLRFGLPPCAIVLGNRFLLAPSRGPLSFLQALLVIAFCCTACFWVSPEMGIACSVGFVSSAVVYFRSGRTVCTGACLAGICLSVALVVGFSSDYFHSVSSFGGGADNFPIYPYLDNVMLVAVCLYILPKMACSVWQQPANPAAPFAAGIGAASVTLLPAALGRCDPSHVLFNGFVVFILLFAACAQISRSLLVGWGVLFGVSFIVLGQVSYWNLYAPEWQHAIQEHDYYVKNPDQVRKWAQAWDAEGMGSKNYLLFNWHKVIRFPEIGDSLGRLDGKIAAPLGADIELDRYLKIRNSFLPGYFSPGYSDIKTPKDVSRIVNEINTKYDYLIVQQKTLSYISYTMNQPAYEKGTQSFLSWLMLYPVCDTFRNKPFIPEAEVAKYLAKNASVIASGEGYFLLKPSRVTVDQ